AHDGDVGDEPLGAVLGHQHDAVAALDARRPEAVGHGGHLLGHRAPRQRYVDAVLLAPQEVAVRQTLRLAEEHGRKAGDAGGIDGDGRPGHAPLRALKTRIVAASFAPCPGRRGGPSLNTAREHWPAAAFAPIWRFKEMYHDR